MHYLIAGLFVITLSALTGCASNEFKADYWGDLYPPTDFAEVVSTPPADATQIGLFGLHLQVVLRQLLQSL